MNSKPILAALALLSVTGSAFAQQPETHHPRQSTVSFVAEVTKLLSKHFPDKHSLQAGAERLARTYGDQLRGFGAKMTWLESEAGSRFGQLSWKQKANLVMELWKIRSSVDLMCLLSPEVLKEITGLNSPDLISWVNRLGSVESKLKSSLPFAISR